MIWDVFNNSAFKLRSLTESINKIPPVFSYLGQVDGLFSEDGVATTTVAVEEQEGMLILVNNSKRGTNGQTMPLRPRKVRAFQVSHKQINDQVLADEVLNIRMFGSETQLNTVASLVADKLETAAMSMEQTLEYMRLGAVKGKVLDADGSVITDLFAEFEQAPREQTWKISNEMSNDGAIKRKCSELIRSTLKILGGTPIRSFELLCGDEIFDAIETSRELRDANRWRNNAEFLVDRSAFRYFEYAGFRFTNYQGYMGDRNFLDPKEAYLLPIGVPGMFKVTYAPADYVEVAGTTGIKYYAKQERLPMDKGIQIECQTNPLVLCTRPAALCKITLG